MLPNKIIYSIYWENIDLRTILRMFDSKVH